MSESAIVSNLRKYSKGLEVLPSQENHLPLDIHLQRMMATPSEEKVFYLIEEGELIALNLAHAKLSSVDLGFLEEFSSLKTLNLTGGNLSEWELPENLASLEYLNLARNSHLTKVIFPCSFPQLKRLWLEECALEALVLQPGFSELKLIFAQSNQLNSLHIPAGMEALEFLDLKANKLRDFQVEGTCPKLWTLYLEENQLTELGADFLKPFPALGRLRLEGNPLHESILSNIKGNASGTLSFIKRYLGDLAQGEESDRETKVLILGNGNVGKSCLVQRMVNDRFVSEWDSTHAISLEQYPKDWEKDDKENLVAPYLLNLWDFGGQDIYHATHRLFMQANAVYLLLWDHKTEQRTYNHRIEGGEERQYENQKLPYWLSYARSQGKDSPVLVVQTKIGRDQKQIGYKTEIEKLYHEQFSSLDFHYVESSTKNWEENGYKALTSKIREAIGKVKTQAKIPKPWAEIRQEVRKLQQGKKKRLPLKDFYFLAQAVENPQDVLTWLSQSGVFFYKEGLFNDEIILDQAWAIEAIYTLFDREQFYYSSLAAKGGEFTGSDLAKIWKDNSEAEQELFVSFMLSCELCFETTQKDEKHYHTAFSKRSFIAPQLLAPRKEKPEVESMLDYAWDKETPIYLRFEHEFLHYGVIQSFIVRTQKLAQKKGIWKTGIFLEWEGEKVQVDAWDQRVDVKASPNSHKLLRKIRKELLDLQGEDAREYVSVDGVGYALLTDLEQQAQMHNAHVQGHWGEKMEAGAPIAIADLQVCMATYPGMEGLKGGRELEELIEEQEESIPVKPQGPKIPPKVKDIPRVYFSYAWGDPEEGTGKSREDIVNALYESLDREEKNYQLFRDKMNLNYGGLISEFMEDIGEGDLIVVFISDKYIRSPYCMWEMCEIGRNCKFDKQLFINRILPIPVERLLLHKAEVLEPYFEHWEKELETWKGFIERRVKKGNASEAQMMRYKKTQEIGQKFGDLADWLVDINASTLKLLKEDDYSKVKETIQNRLEGK